MIFFKGTKRKEQIEQELENQKKFSNVSDETGYVCNICGKFNPISFKFCPYCGTERFKENPMKNGPKPNSEKMIDEDTEYLQKIGLLVCADKQYVIHIQLESGTIIPITLLGKQRSDDALQYLCYIGAISSSLDYRFSDWPNADPCIGPWYHHVSACACELSSEHIYHVESYERRDIILLYGCPNPKSISFTNVLNRVSITAIDYEK